MCGKHQLSRRRIAEKLNANLSPSGSRQTVDKTPVGHSRRESALLEGIEVYLRCDDTSAPTKHTCTPDKHSDAAVVREVAMVNSSLAFNAGFLFCAGAWFVL